MNCPKCGNLVEFVAGDFPTGCDRSPDGYQETWSEKGFYCASCDRVYDESDVSETEEL